MLSSGNKIKYVPELNAYKIWNTKEGIKLLVHRNMGFAESQDEIYLAMDKLTNS